MIVKRYKIVSIKAAILCIIILTGCFFSACQPTPDNTIIIGKDGIDGKTVETQNPDFTEGNNIVTPEISDSISKNVKPAWIDQYLDEHGIFEVNINAEVDIPNVNNFPVIRVRPFAFSDEQLKKVADVFFGDTTIYDGDVPLTKEEIAQAIVEIKAQMKEAKENGWSGAIYSNDYLVELEEKYENAPSIIGLQESDISWVKADDGKGKIDIITKSNDGSYYRITGISSDSSSSIEFRKDLSNYQITGTLKGQPVGVKMTETNAKELAEDYVNALGLNKFQITGTFTGSQYMVRKGGTSRQDNINYDNQCYVFCFTRTIDGIPLTYVQMASGDTDSEDDLYAPPIPKEHLEFYINDFGIVNFKWSDPIEEVERVSNNIKLKDFKDIQEIFINQMKIIGEGRNKIYKTGTKQVINDLVNVNKVSLGMMAIIDKNKTSTYLLIPVWDFFVTVHKDYSDGTSQDGWNPAGNDSAYSILTVNAIDGSIINRNLGY